MGFRTGESTEAQVMTGFDPNDPLGEIALHKQRTGETAATTTTQQPNQEQQASKTSAPVYIGGRRFESMEELAQYTSEIESRNSVPVMSQALENANRPKPSELFYQDPDAFYQLAVEDAENRVMSKLNKKDSDTRLWTKFYDDNKDLTQFKDLVDATFKQKQEQYKNLPAEEGLSKIASETRNMISKIRGSVQGGKELPSGPAKVAGSSNGIAVTHVATKIAPSSFVDQIRQHQKRGKR